MTNKFNVGDKVEFIENYGSRKKGDVVEVTLYDVHHSEPMIDFKDINGACGSAYARRFELVERKPSKNKRISKLEEEVAELKLIVAQIRKPSTVVEEALANDIIEFEGKQYKKVDREAREGDVAIVRYTEGITVEPNTPYKVVAHKNDIWLKHGFFATVYKARFGRTPETVDVYELIVDDKPKTANQLRAEIIEKAKGFVDCTATDDTHFEVNGNQVLAWRIIRKGSGYDARTGVAVCSPKAVFNEDIGKAIAVGRLEGLDVSEFEQAVQPTEFVVGQYVQCLYPNEVHVEGELVGVESQKTLNFKGEDYKKYLNHAYKRTSLGGNLTATIINDTNAQYGGVE